VAHIKDYGGGTDGKIRVFDVRFDSRFNHLPEKNRCRHFPIALTDADPVTQTKWKISASRDSRIILQPPLRPKT
jgi:hypothetical protein